MSKSRIGFIGPGYMGYGMAKNLLKENDVYIIAHKNRDPIDTLVKQGAIEVESFNDLINKSNSCSDIPEFKPKIPSLTLNFLGIIEIKSSKLDISNLSKISFSCFIFDGI